MQAHAHLRLIVSEPPAPSLDEAVGDRVSMVQPLSSARLRWQWAKQHGAVLAMWGATGALLTLAALLALGWV